MTERRRPGRTGTIATLAVVGALLLSATPEAARGAAVDDGRGPAPAVAADGAFFGSLRTDPARAAAESPTMKLAMVEMSWKRAQPTGPDDLDIAYLQSIRDQIDTFRAAGRQVVVGLGMHYEPDWVLALSQMRNQTGAVRTDQANVVFSAAVRSALADYITQADAVIGFEDVWGVRINAAGAQGEIQYPDGNYWAFSTGAQNGADMPAGLAPNPFPGWKPATGDTSLSVSQVEQWALWYQGAMADAMDDQMDAVAATGFRGWFFLIGAGSGARPSTWDSAIAGKLQATSLVGTGVAWDKFYAALRPRDHVVAYSSSTAQSTSYNVCQPGDDQVAIDDVAANSWSAARWMTRVAHENGFAVAGENPGYHDSNDYYIDTTADGKMARAVDTADRCGFLAFFWAHDAQLWSPDLPQTSYSRYAQLINGVTGGLNPTPPFPA